MVEKGSSMVIISISLCNYVYLFSIDVANNWKESFRLLATAGRNIRSSPMRVWQEFENGKDKLLGLQRYIVHTKLDEAED